MAILQALLNFLRGSAGKALNALFGWAVAALFGQVSPSQRTLLSALVAAAAAWPLLALGVLFPKIALVAVAFVPLAKSVPSLWLRLVWVALALLVPLAVSAGISAHASPEERAESHGIMKLLRGYQVTVALAAAFALQLVLSPYLKIRAALRKHQIVRMPLLVPREAHADLCDDIALALASHGLVLGRTAAPWAQVAPGRILRKLGGDSFKKFAPNDLQYFTCRTLSFTLAPNELLLDGEAHPVARAQALVTELLGPRPAVQTFDPVAQDLERQIKRVHAVFAERPEDHRGSHALEGRVREIARDLTRADLPFDEWQVVYRQLLQLDRALTGAEPLLIHADGGNEPPTQAAGKAGRDLESSRWFPDRFLEASMEKRPAVQGPAPELARVSNKQLLSLTAQDAALLVKKEVELARIELKADLQHELAMAKGLGASALCALWTVSLLLVAGALALGLVMPEWAAALVVAGVVGTAGAVSFALGWGKRVRQPLQATRRTILEDVRWAKERIA